MIFIYLMRDHRFTLPSASNQATDDSEIELTKNDLYFKRRFTASEILQVLMARICEE